MRKHLGIAILFGAVVFATPSRGHAEETRLDDFEGARAPEPWTFSNGPEFPGAKGSLTRGAGHSGSGAHLAYDFSGGGAYVAASLKLATPINAAEVGFWVRAPAVIHAWLRVVDSTRQVLQYGLARPFGADDPSAWFRQVVELDAPDGHFGGTNDGVLHGAITQVTILAANPLEKGAVGAIDFDEVVAIDAVGATIDLSTTPMIAEAPGRADLASRLAVNIHFTRDDAGLNAAKGMGFSRVRMDFPWSAVESTKGVYNFSNHDALVASLAARGMTLHLILDYGNRLYPPTGDPAFVSTTVPAFGAYAKAAAAHFAGKGVTFEIWNEANLEHFWMSAPNASDYAALANAAIAAMHAGDPSAKVSTTGVSGYDFAFVRGYLADGGADGADAIGVHPYRLSGGETITDDTLLLRSIAGALPGAPAVWDTEWGYSSTSFGGDGHAPTARAMQATFVVREILSAWAVGFPLAVVYDLRDDGTDPTNAEHNYGLIANDYTDKPAAVSVRALGDVAKGRVFKGLLDLEPTSLYAMRLDGPRDVVVALWSGMPHGRVPVTLVNAKSATSMLGTSIDISSGSIVVKNEDGPTYVTFDLQPRSPRLVGFR
ncbi:MAG TPA: hypothetical protein VK416_02070 [Thermoanaerobaculia bacterium]|nr:hypothetical protein [Thermoanaerobaculia bacterium]